MWGASAVGPQRLIAKPSIAASALAASTRRAYERDWRVFASWSAAHALAAMPAAPATVAAFLAAEADREFRPVTIARRAAAIAAAHRAQDHPNPCDSGDQPAVLSGIRREHGTRPLRKAELVALDVEDLEFDPARGLLLTIRRSKTDEDQEGSRVAVPYARGKQMRRPGAAPLPRGRRDPSRPGVSADAPRRHPHRRAALRPVGRADQQAPR